MPGFGDILGNELAKERLRREIAENRMNHAYLITGEKGIGKKTMAEAVMLSVFCEYKAPESADPCLTCPACKKILSGNHPDAVYVTHAKENTLSVEEIRKQVVDTADMRPFVGTRKIYCIPDADLMTPAAENALLKTLEEPPEYMVILLLAEDEADMLETVRSRVARIRMRAVSDSELEKYLRTHFDPGEDEIEMITVFSRGNIGRAGMLCESGDFALWREKLVSLAAALKSLSLMEIKKSLGEICSLSADPAEIPDMLELFYRDALFCGAADVTEEKSPRFEKAALMKSIRNADEYTSARISEILSLSRRRLRAHVNPSITLELMMLALKEI